MKKTVRRALAATTAGAAGLAGALAFQVPTASAAEGDAGAAAPARFSNLGMGAWSFGTRFVVDGIEARSLRTAFAEMPCTRVVNNEPVEAGLVKDLTAGAIPEQLRDIIDLDALRTINRTYETSDRVGSLATSRVAAINIGGENDLGVPLPKLVISGIESTADAFRMKSDGSFGTDQDISLGSISIKLLPEDENNVPEPLQELLTAIEENIPTDQIVETIIDLTAEFGAIEIPNLGRIVLRGQDSNVYDTGATSESWALAIELDAIDLPDGSQIKPSEIKIGRAFSRIGEGVPGGVFRSWGRPFNASLLQGVLPDGAGLIDLEIPTKSLPCEGTNGQPVTSEPIDTGAIINGLLVKLNDVTVTMEGTQHKTGFINREGKRTNKGWAEGAMSVNVGELVVENMGLQLTNVASGVRVNNRVAGIVKRSFTSDLGGMAVDGRAVEPTFRDNEINEESSRGSILIRKALPDVRFSHGGRMQPFVLSLFDVELDKLLQFNVGESMVFLKKREQLPN